MERKDSLLIVHASDSWLNNNLEPSKASVLKSRIKKRILIYLENNRKVFYTPYTSGEFAPPAYFPQDEKIILIKNPSENLMPTGKLIQFQVISLLRLAERYSINEIEVGGVAINACVKGTFSQINKLSIDSIVEYCNFYGLDSGDFNNLASKGFNPTINLHITDNLVWKNVKK